MSSRKKQVLYLWSDGGRGRDNGGQTAWGVIWSEDWSVICGELRFVSLYIQITISWYKIQQILTLLFNLPSK